MYMKKKKKGYFRRFSQHSREKSHETLKFFFFFSFTQRSRDLGPVGSCPSGPTRPSRIRLETPVRFFAADDASVARSPRGTGERTSSSRVYGKPGSRPASESSRSGLSGEKHRADVDRRPSDGTSRRRVPYIVRLRSNIIVRRVDAVRLYDY